jgi:hypothetical protein
MRDADIAGGGVAAKFLHQIVELALGTAADQLPIQYGADTRTIITAILHPPQAIDQTIRHCFLADDANNAAHEFSAFVTIYKERGFPAFLPENPLYFESPERGRVSAQLPI